MDTLVDSLSLHVDLNVEKTRNGSMVQFQQGTFVASHTSLFPLVSSLKMQKHMTPNTAGEDKKKHFQKTTV